MWSRRGERSPRATLFTPTGPARPAAGATPRRAAGRAYSGGDVFLLLRFQHFDGARQHLDLFVALFFELGLFLPEVGQVLVELEDALGELVECVALLHRPGENVIVLLGDLVLDGLVSGFLVLFQVRDQLLGGLVLGDLGGGL